MKGIFSFLVIITITVSAYTQGLELISDPHYQKGFYVLDQNGNVAGNIHTSTGLDPAWSLAEWHSQSTVLNITPVVLPSGFYKWADSYKDFRFGPEGAEEYHIYFAVNADEEYNHIYRQDGEPWPHLLIEQRLSAPFSYAHHGPGSPSLDITTALIFSIDAKLLYNQTIQESGYDPSLHAAEFLIYFTVQNLNPNSSGYGKYVWLGIPVYDDRYESVSGGVSYDEGTQTLINTIPYDSCANESTHTGNWVHIEVDLLPYALQALQYAWDHGYLNESHDLSDYKIGGMNMGWEVPGRNICTMVTRNMSLRAFTNQTYYITEYASVCYGQNYTFPDGYTATNITATTTHDSHLQAVTGGDSTMHTIVEVNPQYDINSYENVCYGASYTFPDGYTATNITSSISHTSNLTTVNGCDSIIHTTVDVNPVYETSESVEICEGESYTFPDNTTEYNIASDIQHSSLLSTVQGCDSIIHTNIHIHYIDTSVSFNGNSFVATLYPASYQWGECYNGNFIAYQGATYQSFTPQQSGYYAVIINDGICSDTSSCHHYEMLSAVDANYKTTKIFPNPAHNKIYIQNSKNIIKINVYTAQGMLLKSIEAPGNHSVIDVEKFPKGTLIIEMIEKDGNILHQKVLLQ